MSASNMTATIDDKTKAFLMSSFRANDFPFSLETLELPDKASSLVFMGTAGITYSAIIITNQDTPVALTLGKWHEEITELNDKKYELKKPMNVYFHKDEEDFIGEIPTLNIYAFGESIEEILDEINTDLTELYTELKELQEKQLGTEPKKWKKILSEYIKPNNGNK